MRGALATGGIALLLALPGYAADSFEYSGNNLLRVENYSRSGDTGASPFQQGGFQAFDTFQLDFGYRPDRYSSWQGQFSAVGNDSEYRSDNGGLVPQLFALTYENGKSAIPYRVEMGNQYAYYSYRTLRQAYKGVQLELQPRISGSSSRQSLLVTAGVTDPKWRDTEDDPSRIGGIAWLLENPAFGRVGVNYAVHKTPSTSLTPVRFQRVGSITFETPVRFGTQRVDIEGELARFSGDHADIDGPGSGQGQSDHGYFLEARGHGESPLTYRLRFEEYGLHFQPASASVPANRRSEELHLGWRFDGVRARGRIQHYKTGFDESNPEDTTVYGLNVSGRLLGQLDSELSGTVDAWLQNRENDNRTVDASTSTVRVNLNRTIARGWIGQLGVFYSDDDQRFGTGNDRRTTQYSLDLSKRLDIFGIRGVVSPGLGYREVKGATRSNEVQPRIAFNMSNGPHSFYLSMGRLDQRRSGAGTLDTTTSNASVRYRYFRDQDRFSIEANYTNRDPDNSASTRSWRVAATWTHSFSYYPRSRPAGRGSAFVPGTLAEDPSLLVDIPRNTVMADVRDLLSSGDFMPGPSERPYGLAYDVKLLDDVDARQRLIVEAEDDIVDGTALIVDFDEGADGVEAARLYSLVENAMLERFGAPDRQISRGEFGSDWAESVNDGTLVRLMQWRVAGSVVRLGIPRRLDGLVRIEVQAADDMPPVTESYWSLQTVR